MSHGKDRACASTASLPISMRPYSLISAVRLVLPCRRLHGCCEHPYIRLTRSRGASTAQVQCGQ